MTGWQRTMERDWDEMSRQNARYYIFTSDDFVDVAEPDDVKFFDSGRVDVDDILAALHVTPNKDWSVLDIGSGMGRLTRRLAQLFGPTTGVDVSSEMVAKAQTLAPLVRF